MRAWSGFLQLFSLSNEGDDDNSELSSPRYVSVTVSVSATLRLVCVIVVPRPTLRVLRRARPLRCLARLTLVGSLHHK